METRKVSDLKANPFNPRGEVVVDDALHELAASIRVHGVLQPILITPNGRIIAGHRRVKASEIADVADVPVIIRDLDETTQIQVMLIENLQRANLSALQTARAYKTLVDRGLSVRQISMAIGYRPESISRHLNILELPTELHSAFDGEYGIPLGGIQYLLQLDEDKRLKVGLKCKEKGWSIARLRQVVARSKPSVYPGNLDQHVIENIFEKMLDGCYTAEDIATCGECGNRRFKHLSIEEVEQYMNQLVSDGRAEWRERGGRGERQKGYIPDICVPKGTPFGSSVSLGKEIEDEEVFA